MRCRLAVVALGMLAAACSDSLAPDADQHRDPVLTVVADPGVMVATTPAAGAHPAGTSITFTAQLRPGYTALVVTLDSSTVTASGSFVLDRDRILVATSSPNPTRLAASDPLRASMQALIDAARPEFAYQHLMDATVTLAQQVGEDSARKHMAAVADWIYADDQRILAMRRADSLLAGKVFDWRPSADYTPPADARAGRVGIESTGAPASASGPLATVLFVNGILNSPTDAGASLDLVARYASSYRALQSPRTRFRSVYNPSVLLPIAGKNACERVIVANVVRNPSLLLQVLLLDAAGGHAVLERRFQCSFSDDFTETLTQLFDEHRVRADLQAVATKHGPSLELKQTIDQEHGAGHVVLVVAHSQGNLMASQGLRDLQPVNDGPTTCTTFLGIAAPGPQNPGSQVARAGMVAKGALEDFVLTLFGDDGYDKVNNQATSVSWLSQGFLEEHPLIAGTLRGLTLLYSARQIHPLDVYLSRDQGASTALWFQTHLSEQMTALDRQCGGSIDVQVYDGRTNQPLPGALVTPLQASASYATRTGNAAGTASTGTISLRPTNLVITAAGYDTVAIGSFEPAPQGTTHAGKVFLTPRNAAKGTLTGTVTDDATRATVAGATVAFSRNGQAVFQTTTGASGVYRADLTAGTYTIAVTAPGYQPWSGTARVVENTITRLDVALVAAGTANFAGTWVYSAYCNEALGTVDAEMHLTQTAAHVAGDLRTLQSRQGGGWITVEGLVTGNTLTGNSTGWIEPNPSWTLNNGWTMSIGTDPNRIEGAAPITGCPHIGWDRKLGNGTSTKTTGRRLPAAAPAGAAGVGLMAPRS